MVVSLAVSTQHANATDGQTPHDDIGRDIARQKIEKSWSQSEVGGDVVTPSSLIRRLKSSVLSWRVR